VQVGLAVCGVRCETLVTLFPVSAIMLRCTLTRLSLALLFGLPVTPLAAQAPARWTLSAELRIGEDGDIAWSRIAHVAPAPDGGVVVAEAMPPMVYRFDARGTLLHRVGRQGAGPGEYQMIGGVGFVGDTLWVSDARQRRIVLFDAAGRPAGLLSGFDRVAMGPGVTVWPGRLLSGDRALSMTETNSASIASGEATRLPHVLLTRRGQVRDTIAWTAFGNSQLALALSSTQRMFTAQPFSDGPLVSMATTAERAYIVDRRAPTAARGATYGITAVRFTGDTLWSRRYPFEPVALPRTAVDSAIQRMSLVVGGQQVPAATVREALYAPPFRTPFGQALAATDGSLWLRRGDAVAKPYWVHDPSGTLVATVDVPTRVTLYAVNGDVAWGVELDADDVPTIVRYRVRR